MQSINLFAQAQVEQLRSVEEIDSQLAAERLMQVEEELLLVLNNSRDSDKEVAFTNEARIYLIEEIRNDKYEKIVLENGTVLRGFTITENEKYIKFDVSPLSDTLLVSKDHISKYYNKTNHFVFSGDKFHEKEGSVNSIRFQVGGDADHALMHFEFIKYKLINQKQAFGIGGGFVTGTIGFNSVDFTEIFLYSKRYLTNNRKRLFFETKLGVAITHDREPEVDSARYNVFSSGPQLQYGIGIDFANNRDYSWTLYYGHYMQFTKSVYQNTLPRGVINISDSDILSSQTFGISLNF